jgi:hypothetical protein
MTTCETHALVGTEGANSAFFSPDDNWISFLTNDHRKMIPRGGGAVVPLWYPVVPLWCRCGAAVVALWYYCGDARPGDVGARVVERWHARADRDADDTNVLLLDLKCHSAKVVVHTGYGARYVAPRFLLFAHGSSLSAVQSR